MTQQLINFPFSPGPISVLLYRMLQKLLNLETFFRIEHRVENLQGTIRKISVATQHLTQQEEETLLLSLLLSADE